MLSSVLSQSDCASCRFCCSFRRKSLWETPLFDAEAKRLLESRFPSARFRPTGAESFTIDLSGAYKTDDSEEEAPCPFLDARSGCVLPREEKPFDCAIWPFRAMRRGKQTVVALTPTCPAINARPPEELAHLVHDGGLGEKIMARAKKHPDMVKEYRAGFPIIME